jgi:hypothetical protein
MKNLRRNVAALVGVGMSVWMTACGGGGNSTPPPPTTYTLTVDSAAPASGVSITVSPADNNGASSGSTSFTRTYDSETSVTLTAPTTSGVNAFQSWTGCSSVSTTTCTVSMNANTTVTANYAVPTTYALTVDSTNPSSGVAITASPADNSGTTSGSTDFALNYSAGTIVTLTAPATSGSNTFQSWSGGCTSTTTTCTVTVNAATTVTANYVAPVIPTYTVTVNSSDPASAVSITASPADNSSKTSGTTSFTLTYSQGANITLTAPATSGTQVFSSWTGCSSTSTTTCTLSSLAANTTVTANYVAAVIPTYVLTVNSTNPASGVPITVSPADNNSAGNGSTSFTRTYNSGMMVTLTAPATSGTQVFSSWTGCTTATTVTCNVTMSAAATVTANYAAPPAYTLTVNSTNPASGVAITVTPADNNSAGSGTTSFTRSYNSGTSVTLTAPAKSGINTFQSWTGCTSSSGATCTVTMSAAETVTANYTAPPAYTLSVASTNPASGVAIGVTPADNNSAGNGTTSFTRSYYSGTTVTLTAPATSGSDTFQSWTGCSSASAVTCTVSVTGNTTVTANYAAPTTYAVTVASTNPASGVAITVTPADNNSASNGSTSFTRTYNSGTAVTLTAPATSGGNAFSSWTGCSSTTGEVCNVTVSANTTVTANYTASTTYTLTVDSTLPSSGVPITVSPADTNSTSSGTTAFTLTYGSGTQVVLTAPATLTGGAQFQSWTGCAAVHLTACTVAMNSNVTVTANYNQSTVTGVTVSPNTPVTIGGTQQFAATVTGQGAYNTAVTWSVAAPTGSTLSPGTISASGVYITPYPAPATVTVTATSVETTSVSGSVTVTLAAPATATGPALSVNVGSPGNAISPLIYGMNGYALDETTATTANTSIIRFGGDNTSRYNYIANSTNSANDYYFENFTGAGQFPINTGNGSFDNMITASSAIGAEVVGNAPVIGWITTSNVSSTACSFQKTLYPDQQMYLSNGCGNGVEIGGTNLNGNSPNASNTVVATITSMSEPPPTPPPAGTAVGSSWVGTWVASVKSTYGAANSGKGVAHWDLDNEPEYWSGVHRDVHPAPMTYDEITNGGIGTALAIKTSDPTALVSGPIISNWYNFFYSEEDVNDGYGAGPCYKPWSNPADRTAHGGVALIPYYLQQFKAAETTYGMRLLDYVDVHTYFAADYNGQGTGLTSAGNTAEQQVRMNSTRVFWDTTYTDPNYTIPDYTTDSNYTTNCNPPLQAPALIPTLQSWVTNNYPGTKTSIDEYNFGGMESINGAVTQADILGIFGAYGLDKGLLWPTSNYSTQVPGTLAFAMYRNYDGNKSTFGDTVLPASSGNQGQVSVYSALRSTDQAVTVMVINKTYGALTSTISLQNLPSGTTSGQAYLYSNANLNAIVAQPAVTVIAPPAGSTTSTITMTFPAQSITLIVIP